MIKIGSLLAVIIFTVASACNNAGSGNPSGDTTTLEPAADSPAIKKDTSIATPSEPQLPEDSSLLLLTNDILRKIDAGNLAAVEEYIHPLAGTRFSPYGYIDTLEHQRIDKSTYVQLLKTGKKIKWGSMDGSGDPILLSLKQYIKKFVYDVKFVNPEKRSLNKYLGFGNSLNNLDKIYPGSPFTESYFSGFEEKYGGMDWRTLRLVFQQYQGKYYLVAVVHDQWTI